MLAMDVNVNACRLNKRVVPKSIASELAPTVCQRCKNGPKTHPTDQSRTHFNVETTCNIALHFHTDSSQPNALFREAASCFNVLCFRSPF
ncbi:hypothetical protein EJA72_29070 [Pseudomonas sp. PB120]|nr:hypothetical protein [Pseudomonas sp. PB120]